MKQAIFADELSGESEVLARELMSLQWPALLAQVVPALKEMINADRASGRPQLYSLRIGLFTRSQRMPTTIGRRGECGRSAHQGFLVWPAQRFHTLNVKEGWHSFHRELPTQKIWGYDGILPGPAFVERYGVPSIVRIYNDLAANSPGFGSPEITTHLHNLQCASESDGFSNEYYSATKLLFDYIANDGNLLEKPLRDTLKVNLAPAERSDIVVDFASFAGTSL